MNESRNRTKNNSPRFQKNSSDLLDLASLAAPFLGAFAGTGVCGAGFHEAGLVIGAGGHIPFWYTQRAGVPGIPQRPILKLIVCSLASTMLGVMSGLPAAVRLSTEQSPTTLPDGSSTRYPSHTASEQPEKSGR